MSYFCSQQYRRALVLEKKTLNGIDYLEVGGGPGSRALFSSPGGIAMDGNGNIYVADTGNHIIRVISGAGSVTTLAGTAGSPGAADGTGAVARFSGPTGVALDSSGNLYVADTGNNTIRVISSAGVVTTLAGTAGSAGAKNATGPAAQFDKPIGVASDSLGNLYVADSGNNTIRSVSSAGVVKTFAGSAGSAGYKDATGASALFNQPCGVAIDGGGNLYVADLGNNAIRKVTPARMVSTYAGVATSSGSADGPAAVATFSKPAAVSVDGGGNLYVADSGNNTIRMITAAGAVTTLAGTAGSAGSSDGTRGAARFSNPSGLVVDANGNIYVADSGNDTIRRVTGAGVVTTMAGTSGTSGSVDGTGPGMHLFLTMLLDAQSLVLDVSQVLITGGAADAQVHAVAVSPGTLEAPLVVTIKVDKCGDFSPYTFRLIAKPGVCDPPPGLDPQLSHVIFSFKAGCPTTGDCLSDNCCPPDLPPEPDINYLAKDYDGFRQVMLDRMAVLTSTWTETHVPDIGITLVEILAYVADHLSYQQDAIGTEAYLGTARSRISLRRHARLVDYQLNEGCNARAWIYMKLQLIDGATDGEAVPALTQIFPFVPGVPPAVDPNDPDQYPQMAKLVKSAPAFSTMSAINLYVEQNQMTFYTWGNSNCCLGPGSTEATLVGTLPTLVPGTVLVFEEVIGPETGDPDDADPAKRWAVMLTDTRTVDYLNNPLMDHLTGTLITEIRWGAADGLPFPLCISSTTDVEHGQFQVENVSVALGNIVPADQGLWLGEPEDMGDVPAAPASLLTQNTCACNSTSPVDMARSRYYPQLANSPLTFALGFDTTAASAFLNPPIFGAAPPTPQITVTDDNQNDWTVLHDLLSSDENDRACVVEIEYDGTVFVRFGDGTYGTAPPLGASFQAMYRVGNGTVGNVGHDTLAHALTPMPGIVLVRNPLAAAGGVDPETMEHIRQVAPFAFLTQLRAVTQDDYGTMAELDPAIREARGTLRWTGSWYTAFVSIDSVAENLPATLVTATEKRLNTLRMIGTDLDAEGARIVGLRIEMAVCVDLDHFQGDVEAAIEKLLITGNQCNGQPGILNAANFTFGETVYTSPLVAAVQGVEGVASATITVFQRMDDPSIDGATQGFLMMARLEIARCDNDPDRIDNGILLLHMGGGK